MKDQKGSYEINILVFIFGLSLAITIGMVEKGSNMLIYVGFFIGCFILLLAILLGIFRLQELYN